ncbi:hypothetical protein ARMSODRAFT_956883 [Armillaria solidipes]|uniref:Uncharacterized protein n=1 Tax=Armillaria solidipes TaxID=1076256 RepID=A0A2H3BEM4_9AGAR|nr:hypothetical protein ARMSODRAFT_956883 [Armillaria solidipes]
MPSYVIIFCLRIVLQVFPRAPYGPSATSRPVTLALPKDFSVRHLEFIHIIQ